MNGLQQASAHESAETRLAAANESRKANMGDTAVFLNLLVPQCSAIAPIAPMRDRTKVIF
ncbi:MAG: hypothetical protein LCH71_17615 [Proteobacteria bacterium]|jgi:hypothetical protein|nr:hypothetical protein [Pseudomonadota bacterium]